MEKFLVVLFFAICGPVVLFMLYAIFFITPVAMYTDAECLRNGYPRAEVSIGLERYCMNLEGSVTVKVDHLGKK